VLKKKGHHQAKKYKNMKRTVAKTFKVDCDHDKSMWKDDKAFTISHTSNEIKAKNQNTINIIKHGTCKTFLYCILIKATSDET
jgi:hypothetical protein